MGERGAARINLTIPPTLKAEMDAAPGSVNWSSVAADAFRGKLLELASRRETKNMQDVINRLKAAKKIEENQVYQEGFAAGERWAKEDATPKELQRVEKHIDRDMGGADWWDTNYPGWDADCGASDHLALAITGLGSDRIDSRFPRHFWEGILGEDAWERINDPDFLHGFGDGAVALWKQVADSL